MTAKMLFLFFALPVCPIVCAQQDSIVPLREVRIADGQLRHFSNTQSVLEIRDSIIRKNAPSLTSLLNYNTVIYFKEYGLGMVSSPSFRGTTAQQTAVIWNGININSQFNGQTDFNAINTSDFQSIAVRAGGGSVIYGSSAMGGSIHLDNDFEFGRHFNNRVDTRYGSFNTLGLQYQVTAGSDAFSVQANISRNSSNNDYQFVGSDRHNANGQFYNTSASASIGHKINSNQFLKYYSHLFEGERHFSLISPSDTKAKYRDFNTRNLLEWDAFLGKFLSKLKVAYLKERYYFFENLDTTAPEYGQSETAIGKHDLTYRPTGQITINSILDVTQTKGWGSNVRNHTRQIGSTSLLMKHQVFARFEYELGIRKELTDNYDSPLLFSAGLRTKFGKHYTLRLHASRNFRIPTFNDLYWRDGGNTNLKPESSYQYEMGHAFEFGRLKFSITGYAARINDMIQWLPGTTASWFPQNVNKVNTHGIEGLLEWRRKSGRHEWVFNGTYAYTVSKNGKTGHQLIYVPYHKATAAIAYTYRKFSANCHALLNGEVFTRSDNNSRYNLDGYAVSNIGADYDFGEKNTYKLGIQLLNAFNENYQSMANRPFPGRHYNFYLTLNF